jgi:hypothetical protein
MKIFNLTLSLVQVVLLGMAFYTGVAAPGVFAFVLFALVRVISLVNRNFIDTDNDDAKPGTTTFISRLVDPVVIGLYALAVFGNMPSLFGVLFFYNIGVLAIVVGIVFGAVLISLTVSLTKALFKSFKKNMQAA